MSRHPASLAPHVRAAIERTGAAPAPAAQPRRPGGAPQGGAPPGGLAPHVQAAIQRSMAPAARPAAQLKPGDAKGGEGGDAQQQPPAASALHAVTDFVTYTDLKSSGAPPPPPRRPVLALSCADGACSVQDVKTGRVRPAGDIFGGFVRMDKGSQIYVSPRAGVGAPGDSHPTIASGTPEWQAGRRTVVAAGEVGILKGEIVGHNDKTGHFQSRKNLRQSGMPAERFHPFTEDPKDWYK